MQLKNYLQTIQLHLVQIHAQVLNWFEIPQELKQYRPNKGAWTITEIIEHISLTSHFLLILIDKGANKAQKNLSKPSLEEELSWIRPEPMEPQGNKSGLELKDALLAQLREYLNHWENLKNGEGLLYKTTLAVNRLGKLNVCEYIYFLSKHAERHLQQMEASKQEFLKQTKV